MFDGQSLVFGPDGGLVARAAAVRGAVARGRPRRGVAPSACVAWASCRSRGPTAVSTCPAGSRWGVEIITVDRARSAAGGRPPRTTPRLRSERPVARPDTSPSPSALSRRRPRSTRRCAWGWATTCGRTASSRWSWASAAVSTRRSRPASRPTPLGKERVDAGLHALALLQRRYQERRSRDGRAAGGPLLRDPHREHLRLLPGDPGSVSSAERDAGSHRAEHPGPHPRATC